jgi:hypothetical protein
MKIIELTFKNGDPAFFNVDAICCIYPADDSSALLQMINSDLAFNVAETPRQVMKKIKDA